MRSNAIIFADYLDGSTAVIDRPPRIIAPLQHIFDPILGMSDFYPASRWGDSHVSISRFSQRPRIVFDHLPATLPTNLGEAMLYYLQRRLVAERLIGTPAERDASAASAGVDAGITIRPA